MVGSQNRDIIDLCFVERREQPAEIGVQRRNLCTAFRACGAESVADIVGSRQADRQHIGSAAFAQLPFGKRGKRKICGQRVKFASGAESAGITSLSWLQCADRCVTANRHGTRMCSAHLRKLNRGRLCNGGLCPSIDRGCRSGKRVAFITAKRLAIPPDGQVGIVPAHHHRAAILARNGDDL